MSSCKLVRKLVLYPVFESTWATGKRWRESDTSHWDKAQESSPTTATENKQFIFRKQSAVSWFLVPGH